MRRADFSKPGWHARPTAAYHLMFEFLRLSPSYELARIANKRDLTAEERLNCPSDFADVLATYQLLGNVQRILFETWWKKRGLKVFGNPYSKPSVHNIAILENAQLTTNSDIEFELRHYLEETRSDEGFGPTMLIAIPLNRRKGEVLNEISRLLEQQSTDAEPDKQPQLALMGQRIHKSSLFKGIRLMWFKAAKPNLEYWRLGILSKISKKYSASLDAKGPRKTQNPSEIVERDLLTKLTYRALNKFEAIAENAARGRFPSEATVEQLTFDYPKIRRMTLSRELWEKAEEERLVSIRNQKRNLQSVVTNDS